MSTVPMKQEDHDSHNMPDASEQYAGDVISMPKPSDGLSAAHTGQWFNSIRTSSDRTNVTPIRPPVQIK